MHTWLANVTIPGLKPTSCWVPLSPWTLQGWCSSGWALQWPKECCNPHKGYLGDAFSHSCSISFSTVNSYIVSQHPVGTPLITQADPSTVRPVWTLVVALRLGNPRKKRLVLTLIYPINPYCSVTQSGGRRALRLCGGH